MIVTSDRTIRFFERVLKMKGIRAMALFPFVVISSSTQVDDELINHERIHLRQQCELLVLPFYIWYLIAFIRKGYMGISFEKEAYANENDLTYLKKRSIFAFRKYIKK